MLSNLPPSKLCATPKQVSPEKSMPADAFVEVLRMKRLGLNKKVLENSKKEGYKTQRKRSNLQET